MQNRDFVNGLDFIHITPLRTHNTFLPTHLCFFCQLSARPVIEYLVLLSPNFVKDNFHLAS